MTKSTSIRRSNQRDDPDLLNFNSITSEQEVDVKENHNKILPSIHTITKGDLNGNYSLKASRASPANHD